MSKVTKKYEIDGKRMQFNFDTFNDLFVEKMKVLKELKINVAESERLMGEAAGVSPDAVHAWRFRQNAPMEIKTIKKAAEYLGLPDFAPLLKEVEEEMPYFITDRQYKSLKRVYDAVVDFLWDFEMTNGFTGYRNQFKGSDMSLEEIEKKLYETAEAKRGEVLHTLRQEFLFVNKVGIYEALEEFVCNDLRRTYDGKLSAGDRAGRGAKDEIAEDYKKAIDRINYLLDPYMY